MIRTSVSEADRDMLRKETGNKTSNSQGRMHRLVGWVERSETHRGTNRKQNRKESERNRTVLRETIGGGKYGNSCISRAKSRDEATARNRTADILITSEVLCRLSYGGLAGKQKYKFFWKNCPCFFEPG